MEQLYANTSVSISELKKNPSAIIERAEGFPVRSHVQTAGCRNNGAAFEPEIHRPAERPLRNIHGKAVAVDQLDIFLVLVGVTPSYTTAQGGTVRLYGDTVRYIPPAGSTGNDTFDYTVTDLSGVPIHASVAVTVAAPLALTITRNPDGSVTVSWPKPADGWVLDEATALGSTPAATSWSQVAAPYDSNPTTFSVTVPSPTGNKFYRLRK